MINTYNMYSLTHELYLSINEITSLQSYMKNRAKIKLINCLPTSKKTKRCSRHISLKDIYKIIEVIETDFNTNPHIKHSKRNIYKVFETLKNFVENIRE